FDAVFGAQISLHVPVDHDLAGNDVGGDFGGWTNGELALVELDQSFDRAVDLQILIAGDFAFDVQTRAEPRGGAVSGRTQGTQCISTHTRFPFPSRRSGLRRLIGW